MATDSDIERVTVRALSWRLLPLIGLGYLVSYMDRVNIGFAAPTMNVDLGISAAAYGFGGGLFFISYALLEIPSNLILVRVGPRRWLARILLTWGLIAMATAFIRNAWQFYLIRFLLGAAEAGFFPGVIYYVGLWFPQAHRGRAVTRFYCFAPLASVVMGAVAGSLLGLDGHLGLRGWQWLLLVEGAPAVILSAVFLKWLPDRPAEVGWLSGEQKSWLAARLAADDARIGAPDHDILRALARPPVLALAAINFLMLGPSYAFTLTAPAILAERTGFSPGRVGLLVALGGLMGALAQLANGWLSDRRGERFTFIAAPLLLAAGALWTLAFGQSAGVVVTAYVALMAFYFAAGVFWLGPGEFVHPRAMAISLAAINTVGQLGSFFFPWIWGVAKDATGGYQLGLTLLPLTFGSGGLIALALWQVRRRRLAATPA